MPQVRDYIAFVCCPPCNILLAATLGEACQFFLMWVRFNDHFQQEWISEFKIVDYGLQGMKDDCAFDVASELLSEIIFQSSRRSWNTLFGDLSKAINECVNLLVAAVADENDDLVDSINYVVVDFAFYYLGEIIGDQHLGSSVFDCILNASNAGDYKTIEMSFRIWEAMTNYLKQNLGNNLPRHLEPILQRLVMVLLEKLKYAENALNWNSQKRDDFREFRHVIGDCLKDCCELLGVDVVLGLLSQPSSENTWPSLEARLTALRLVASMIDDTKPYPELLSIFSHLSSFWSTATSQRLYLLEYAIVLAISSYAPWIHLHHKKFDSGGLAPIVSILQQTISRHGATDMSNVTSKEDDKVLVAASFSLYQLCKYCNVDLAPSYGSLVHSLYNAFEAYPNVSVPESLFKSLLCLILVTDNSISMLVSLAQDLIQNKLTSLLQRSDSNTTQPLISALLERYRVLLEESRPEKEALDGGSTSGHPLSSHFCESLSLLRSLYALAATPVNASMEVESNRHYNGLLEQLAKLLKTAMQVIPSSSLLETGGFAALLSLLSFAFETSKHSSVIYISQTLVRQFSYDPNASRPLLLYLKDIHDYMITLGGAQPESISGNAIEDYFYLISVILEYFPDAFYLHPEPAYYPTQVVFLGIKFLSSCVDPSGGKIIPEQLLICFTILLEVFYSLNDSNHPVELRQALKERLLPLATPCFSVILKLVVQFLPHSMVPDASKVLYYFLCQLIPTESLRLVTELILGFHQFSPFEKEQFLANFKEINHEKSLTKFLRSLSRTAERHGAL